MKIDWIDDKLAISGAIDNYDKLVELGISMVINVMAEQHDDVQQLTKRNIPYYWIPVTDWHAPRSDQIKTFLTIISRDDKTLVHCAVGKGRTGFFAVAYLIYEYKMSIDDAVAKAKGARSIIDLTPVQVQKLKVHFQGR